MQTSTQLPCLSAVDDADGFASLDSAHQFGAPFLDELPQVTGHSRPNAVLGAAVGRTSQGVTHQDSQGWRPQARQ
ncbi:hypothetical protein PPL_12339 [Heterostelium album PN500]|uniref:Uncharacterized protein n=1 Tax=Heterostelium pallidum (strain ATCC 26659 / Pp 5 / PN500) TaxID=670386 RepID=D3BMC6_HETP5|nr:hypothetical protein PPL_12339 [Heterostelium album PN500]EFA77727.1 hypothetical protein PPL_12339 [Heterostelium album PN500]|eukprot:XP_020429855.1 hypothetical protein PPL_12339 [Heterostelium album PN500]